MLAASGLLGVLPGIAAGREPSASSFWETIADVRAPCRQCEFGVAAASNGRSTVVAGQTETRAYTATSTDLRRWVVSRSQPSFASAWISGFTWWRERWWAVGGSSAGPLVVSSPDGLAWRRVPMPAGHPDGLRFFAVAASDDRIVAVGDSVTNDPNHMFGDVEIWSSAEGATWERADLDLIGALYDVAAEPDGTMVAVGATDAAYGPLLTSADGRSWRNILFEHDGPSEHDWVVRSSTGIWLTGGRSGTMFRSSDGSAWESVAGRSQNDHGGWIDATWAGHQFLGISGHKFDSGISDFGSSSDATPGTWTDQGYDRDWDDPRFGLDWTEMLSVKGRAVAIARGFAPNANRMVVLGYNELPSSDTLGGLVRPEGAGLIVPLLAGATAFALMLRRRPLRRVGG